MPTDKRTTGFVTTRQLKENYFSQFPQDEELQLQIVDDLINEGYEVEGFNTSFSAFNALKNVIPSTVDVAKSVVHSVYRNGEFVGDETIKSLGKVALGILPKSVTSALFGTENSKEFERSFDAMTDFFVDRYGSLERLGETVERDPAGFLADLSTFVGGGAGAVKAGTKIAGKSAKLSSSAQKAIKGAEVAKEISRKIEPFTIATKGTFKAMGSLFDHIARRQTRGALGISKAQARDLSKKTFLDVPPEKAFLELGVAKRLALKGKTANINNVRDELDIIWRSSKQTVDDMLSQADGKLTRGLFPSGTDKILRQVRDQFDSIPLNNMSPENIATVRNAQSLLDEFNTKGLSLTKLNQVKRLLDEVTNLYRKSGEPKDQLRAKNLSDLRSGLRGFIERKADQLGFPQVRKQNNTTAFAKELAGLADDAIKSGGTRSRLMETAVGIYGASSALNTGNLAPLGQAFLLIGGLEVMQTPIFRNTMAAILNALSDKEVASIERAIQTGRASKQTRQTIRNVAKNLIDLMPEARAAGVVAEQVE